MRAAIDRALVIASESRLSTIPLKGFFSPPTPPVRLLHKCTIHPICPFQTTHMSTISVLFVIIK